jgi:hypothetical protein
MSPSARLARIALPVATAAAACSPSASPPAPVARVGLHVQVPKALLDGIDSLSLYVADSAADTTCTPATGVVSKDLTKDKSAKVFPLARKLKNGSPCPENGVFCSDEIQLATDPAKQLVFQAIGLKQNSPYAIGCATQAVNADPLYVRLTMHHYVAPAVCGDGVIQPCEQCEGSGAKPAASDPICDTSCRSKEILLSNDNQGPASLKITNDPPGSKKRVATAWSAAPNEINPNPFHAVFQDTNFGSTGSGPEINYRQMSLDLLDIATPPLLRGEIRLPKLNGNPPGFDQRPRTQGNPSVGVLSNGSVIVAYEDDQSLATGQTNISVTPFAADATSAQADLTPANLASKGACEAPSVAGGPTDLALVVWSDKAASRIRGRIWNVAAGWVTTGQDLDVSAAAGSQPRVAGWSGGWTVVFRGAASDNDDILMVEVASDGTVGTAAQVNDNAAGAQETPAVAATPTGEIVVAWASAGDIMMQRYDAARQKIAGDQAAPVNNERPGAGAGSNPAASATALQQGFFALAWQSASGQIHGRFAALGAGFLFNSIDGQDGSFPVGRDDVHGTRSAPSVAIGGAGHVVLSWQDDAADHYGIWARRFPLAAR